MSLQSARQRFLRKVYELGGLTTCRQVSSWPTVDMCRYDGKVAIPENDIINPEHTRSLAKLSPWQPALFYRDNGIYETIQCIGPSKLYYKLSDMKSPIIATTAEPFAPPQILESDNFFFLFCEIRGDKIDRYFITAPSDGGVMSFLEPPHDYKQTSVKGFSSIFWLGQKLYSIVMSDYYAVEKSNPDPGRLAKKSSKRKPWRTKGRSIVFMTPGERRTYRSSTTPKDNLNPGHKRSSHHRRGHWRTLRHERFKHNPDGTPRRVWSKAAWVGPQEWIEDGTEYRILEPIKPESVVTESDLWPVGINLPSF